MTSVIARNEAIYKLCVFALHIADRNDRKLKRPAAILFLLLLPVLLSAQSPYDNNVYRPEIKSVEFYNTAKQSSFPIIRLGSDEKVLLAFDNLKGGSQTYNY